MEPVSQFANQFNSPAFQLFISEKWRYKIAKHGLLNLLLVFIFFFQYLDIPADKDTGAIALRFTLSALLYLLSAALIYLNIYFLVPNVLFRGKLSLYLSFVGLCALGYTTLILFGFPFITPLILGRALPAESFKWTNFIDTLILPSIFLASTTGIKVMKKWILDTLRMNVLEKQQLQEELKQLKSQVNPHFLFNTLNNLHTLTKIDPDRASQVLISLSDILRYQLYEGNREKVLLTKDIENIRQLLSLEKVRRDQFEYHLERIGNMEGQLLPPFLFTPFVENAVKHSASAHENAHIELTFKTTETLLMFECTNSKPKLNQKKEVGGLGLQNIKRRLELLYPATHQLEINETPDTYHVIMTIPI